MGYMRAHAVLVTSFSREYAEAARALAVECGLEDLTTPLVDWRVNGGASFAVLPDGSKEGWEPSDQANEQRARFVQALTLLEDKQVYVDWALVQFADDDHQSLILMHSDQEPAP